MLAIYLIGVALVLSASIFVIYKDEKYINENSAFTIIMAVTILSALSWVSIVYMVWIGIKK